MFLLPIYINLEDFKENYLLHFHDWINGDFFRNEGKTVDFDDYLEYYSDIITDTYSDIVKEVEKNDLDRLKEISKEIRVSDSIVMKYIENNYKDDPDYDRFKLPENFLKEKMFIECDLVRTYGFDEYAIDHILDIYAYCVDDINNFIYQERLKLDAYKSLQVKPDDSKVQSRHTTPVIIAILKELKLIGELNKRGFTRAAIIDTLFQIIGTNKKNIENYYDSMIKQDNNSFKKSHIEKSKEYLNSKGF